MMVSPKIPSAVPIIVLVIIADSVLSIDYAAVGVAMPSIGVALSAKPAQLQWVISAFSLALAGLVIVGGRLTDSYGEGPSYFVGCFLAAVGDLLAIASSSITILIVARCIQGIAAAILIPTALSLIASRFPDGPQRLRVLAIHVAAGAIVTPIGTLLAGLLITHLSWQAGFLVMLPFPFAGMFLGYYLLGIRRREGAKAQPINLIAAATVTTGLTLLVWSLSGIFASLRSPSEPHIVALAVSLVILAGFVLQQRNSQSPLIPLGIMRRPNFAVAMVVAAFLNLCISGGNALVHMSLQRSAGFSPFESALMYIPKGLLSVLLGLIVVPRTAKFLLSNPRRSLAVAVAIIVAAQIVMSFASSSNSMILNFLVPMLIVSFGYVFGTSIVMREMFRHVSAGEHGLAAALLNASRYVFMAVGMSMIISVVDAGRGGTTLPLTAFAVSYRLSAGFGFLGMLMAIFLMRPSSAPKIDEHKSAKEIPYASPIQSSAGSG